MKRLRNGMKTSPPGRSRDVDISRLRVTIGGKDVTEHVILVDDRDIVISQDVKSKG